MRSPILCFLFLSRNSNRFLRYRRVTYGLLLFAWCSSLYFLWVSGRRRLGSRDNNSTLYIRLLHYAPRALSSSNLGCWSCSLYLSCSLFSFIIFSYTFKLLFLTLSFSFSVLRLCDHLISLHIVDQVFQLAVSGHSSRWRDEVRLLFLLGSTNNKIFSRLVSKNLAYCDGATFIT